MTEVERLAAFVERVSFRDVPSDIVGILKARVLDSLGCAIGALGAQPIRLLREQIDDFGGRPLATLIAGGRTAPDRAAFYNSALVRYLDFNDSYLAPGETCHPSDNLGAVLAASEYASAGGKELLTALAVAYEVQCRLSEAAPVRDKGFDHTTQEAYAAAAGAAKALALPASQAAHAIAISGAANNALRVTRTGALSNWKGLASPNTCFAATHAAFLAMRGVTGPLEVFEGNKGFMESIAGAFQVDWEAEGLGLARRTILKKYNAEIHSQSVLESILDLREALPMPASQIERIEVDIFDVAYNIIGGGEEGDKRTVRTKEEADHSLPYLVAVAVLDGQVKPPQFASERLSRKDVQDLLQRVIVRPDRDLSRAFPAEMPCRVRILFPGGRVLFREKRSYEGFFTQPMSWDRMVEKFGELAAPFAGPALQEEIIAAVAQLDTISTKELMRLLARVGKETAE